METVLAVVQLLTRLFEAAKAFLELKGSGEKTDDHPDARRKTCRPRHLRE